MKPYESHKIRLLTLFWILLILGGTVAFGQIPPSPIDRMLDRMGVDAGKREPLKKVFNQARADQMKFRLQMDKKQIELKELLIADKLDMGKLKQNCDDRSKIFGDMQFSQLSADAEVKKSLTADQWLTYIEIRGAMGDHMRKHGGPDAGGKKPDQKPESKPDKK